MKLVRKSIAATFLFAVFSISSIANAALIERLGGLAYYDDVADLTWLANANANGVMNWTDANAWAGSLVVGGVDGWRLPDSDGGCSGHYCKGSEMGDLFYNALGNPANSLSNRGPFSNVQSNYYWSATEFPDPNYAWIFAMDIGYQYHHYKTNNFYAWAVLSGDVGAVPVPAAVWLFGSGLIGLIGVARCKKA